MDAKRLTGIDDSNRGQHTYLTPADTCLFLGEYFSYGGYDASATNQLVLNLKIPPTRITENPYRARHKNKAIAEVAETLRRVLGRQQIEGYTWVPIPSSKTPQHPDYDPRLLHILEGAFEPYDADIRQLLRQTEDTEADHLSAGSRMTYEELLGILELDTAALKRTPIRPHGIILFDDILTSGKHFKCCEGVLRQVLHATIPIKGAFVARRVIRAASADEFEDST